MAPFGNYLVIVMMSTVFALQFLGDPNKLYLNNLILNKFTYTSAVGYFWLHLDLLHVVSNMILLVVFGKAASTQIGAGKYFIVYVLLGVAAGLAHAMLDGRPAIGSSGAVCGIMGVAIVLSWKKLSPLGPWLILTWLALSIIAALDPANPDASIAHIAGFLAGMAIATVMLAFGQADSKHTCTSLVRLLKHTPSNKFYRIKTPL